MAFKRKCDVGQAFRDDQQLRQFVLTDVTPTGRVLGTGSYGSVEEVTYKHLVCAGKKLHETLIDVENEGVAKVVRKYLQECQLMSSLRHPNITQFLGLCFLPGIQLPLLVMECLETSLDDLLEHMPNLPLSLKRSVLEDVARGLLYLHDRHPPVIHRDLTSKNVLLTSSLLAKITDMGNSRIVTMRPSQMARTLTKYPGTLVYMPPEAQDDMHRYGAAMDIFSFGHLALFTSTQIFPGDILPSTYLSPNNNQDIRARSEVERRGVYIELLESQLSAKLPALVELVKQCLHNDPRERPSTEELLTRLQGMRREVEGEYGGPVKLDMVRVSLAKKVKEKDRRIEELTQQQEEAIRRHVEETTRQLGKRVQELQAEGLAKEREIQQLQNEVVTKRRVEELQAQVQAKDEQIAAKELLITRKDELIARKGTELEEFRVREARLRRELAAQGTEMTRLREALREHQGEIPGGSRKEQPLKFPLHCTWKRGPDMPFEMSTLVSIVLQGKLYVGGGYADCDNAYIVMEYDIGSGKWTTLPPYGTREFAMAVISKQLVLLGGNKGGVHSKVLGVWRTDRKVWTHPYPEMSAARSECSVVVYNQWLVVAGGWAGGEIVPIRAQFSEDECRSSVEVLNTDTKQWFAGPPTPIQWCNMKAAVVGEMGYFMGGRDYILSNTKTVYCVDIPTLLSHITSKASSKTHAQIWKEIPGLQLTRSTPLSISGSLLAVGGWNSKAVTAIHLYQHDSGVWVKVGELPSPRYNCTCAVTADREVVVAGGNEKQRLKRVDFAHIV